MGKREMDFLVNELQIVPRNCDVHVGKSPMLHHSMTAVGLVIAISVFKECVLLVHAWASIDKLFVPSVTWTTRKILDPLSSSQRTTAFLNYQMFPTVMLSGRLP